MAEIIKFSDIVASQKSQQMAVDADQLQELTRAVVIQAKSQAANQEEFIQDLNESLKQGFEKVTGELKTISKIQARLGSAAEQGSKYTPLSAMDQIKGGIKEMKSVEGWIDVEKSSGLIGNALKRRKARKEFINEQMEMDTSLEGTDDEKKAILTERFKEVEKLRSRASDASSKIEQLRAKGYTEEQIERSAAGKDLRQIDQEMQQADPLYKEKNIDVSNNKVGTSTSEETQQDALKVQLDTAKENTKIETDTLVVLREQKQVLTKIEANTKAFLEKQYTGDASADGDINLTSLPGKGGALASGAKIALSGAKTVAGKVAPYAIPAAIAYGAANALDYGAGALGVGKDKEGNVIQVDAEQDDDNWQKMTVLQKMQSGIARGIEKTGSFVGLGNMARQAQANRIKSETEYFNKAPGSSASVGPATETTSSVGPATETTTFNELDLARSDPKLYQEFKARRDELFQENFDKRKSKLGPNASQQSLDMNQRAAETYSNIVAKKEFAERASKLKPTSPEPMQATPSDLSPANGRSTAAAVEQGTIEVEQARDAATSPGNTIINAPQSTNINNSTVSSGGKPVTRNTDSTVADLNRSRYRFA